MPRKQRSALGDFGATMIVGGAVPMATTMPIALYNAVFYGSHQQATILALVQIGVAFAILLGVSRLGKEPSAIPVAARRTTR